MKSQCWWVEVITLEQLQFNSGSEIGIPDLTLSRALVQPAGRGERGEERGDSHFDRFYKIIDNIVIYLIL